MPSNATNEATRREWRELGFFYDQNDDLKEWRLVGSRVGLCSFAERLKSYANHPAASTLSEHVHLGPYGYLEIGTWSEAEITSHWIAGSPEDLIYLANLIVVALGGAAVGAIIRLRPDFAPDAPFDLALEVREDGFDPAGEDTACW